MSLAIRFGDLTDPQQTSGLIYLDAVTSYTKSFTGKITEHPIEAGANISDHFISNNPKFQVTGVISGVDVSVIPSSINVEGQSPLNMNPQPDAIRVNDIGSALRQYIPDFVEQFIPFSSISIGGGDSSRKDYRQEVESLLEKILNGIFYNEQRQRYENRMTLATIYEYNGLALSKKIDNLVIVSYSTEENVDSGDGLFLTLGFEQARFVTLEKAEAPKPQKGSSTEKGATPTKNKGTAPSNPTTDPPEAENRVYSTDILGGG